MPPFIHGFMANSNSESIVKSCLPPQIKSAQLLSDARSSNRHGLKPGRGAEQTHWRTPQLNVQTPDHRAALAS
jgi:hypothetical protein